MERRDGPGKGYEARRRAPISQTETAVGDPSFTPVPGFLSLLEKTMASRRQSRTISEEIMSAGREKEILYGRRSLEVWLNICDKGIWAETEVKDGI